MSSDERVWPDGGADKEPVATTSADQARATARTFLEEAGLPDDVETVGPPGSWVEVQVDPEVDGLPTTGLGTTLVVTADAVQSGAGWLATTARGPAYPLVTAREAWDALVRTPLPMPLAACAEPPPDAVDPVACGGPVTVTGARLGLSLQETDDGPMLLPAWLFTVAKSMHPLVQLAVVPRLLAASDGGAAGGTSGRPGSAVPPAAPSTAPSPEAPSSRFTSVLRGDDGRSIDVTFWGGVPECYDYDVRAVENDRAVSISVVERRSAGDKPCIDLAVEVRRTVRLEAPLGHRPVLDAETGEALLGPPRSPGTHTGPDRARRAGPELDVSASVRQWNESPQAQDPPAFGLSIVKPCFSIVSTKSIEAPPR